MFSETSIVNLFPAPVWVHRLARKDAKRINDEVLEMLKHLKASSSSFKAGRRWRTPRDMHTRPGLAELNRVVEAASRGVLDHLRAECKTFRITNCWVDIEPKWGAPREREPDSENFLSGLYAIQTAAGSSLLFRDPRLRTESVALGYKEPTQHNSLSATLSIEEGSLIMFPAWLQHSLNNSAGAEDCITIGFTVSVVPGATEAPRARAAKNREDT